MLLRFMFPGEKICLYLGLRWAKYRQVALGLGNLHPLKAAAEQRLGSSPFPSTPPYCNSSCIRP